MQRKESNMENENELVDRQFACPKCGKRIMDDLVWIDDEAVKCTHCQTEYNPLQNTANKEAT